MTDDSPMNVCEGDHLWSPDSAFIEKTALYHYTRWLRETSHGDFPDYSSMWKWSTEHPDEFWSSIWTYFRVESATPYKRALAGESMQDSVWFEGSSVNYAEHLLRYERQASFGETALYYCSENQTPKEMDWYTLGNQVRVLATQMRRMGIEPGDRVAAIISNTPEAVVAMLATVSIGAIWSSASPEFGLNTVVDRFSQIEPRLLVMTDGYHFGGKSFRNTEKNLRIIEALPCVEHIVWLDNLEKGVPWPNMERLILWNDLLATSDVPREQFEYTRVQHNHPLWILFSSGTTGLPKAIVHSHVGILLEHLKVMHLHINLRPQSVLFFYSSTGWMMWNILVASLLTGSAAVLYDGSPTFPTADTLWRIAAQTGTTNFGASPTFVRIMKQAEINPAQSFDLSRLESIILSGAPSPPEIFDWFYKQVSTDIWVSSHSGGTEICSAFVGGVPTLPVYAGEIQARALGMNVNVFRENGTPAPPDEIGELVVTTAFPSMPLCFWGDGEGCRYHDSYFNEFPNVWRHGDFIKVNRRGGCFIYGRSDATLNRHGVRIGSAEIYRILERIPEVTDSLVLCYQTAGGEYYVPLFVSIREGEELDSTLKKRIIAELKEQASPRHVPDEIYRVSAVPYTLTGKKMEIPVKKLLQGIPAQEVASKDSMANPDALEWFVHFAQQHTA